MVWMRRLAMIHSLPGKARFTSGNSRSMVLKLSFSMPAPGMSHLRRAMTSFTRSARSGFFSMLFLLQKPIMPHTGCRGNAQIW